MNFSIFGDKQIRLRPAWVKETSVGIFADVEIDASSGTGPGAVLTTISVFGDQTVSVSEGSRVTVRGFRLFGDSKVAVSPGDGPELTIKAYAVFGDLTVTDRSGK